MKRIILLIFLTNAVFSQNTYNGMNSWYHTSSAVMAGGGSAMASAESDRINPAAIFGFPRLMHISLIQYPADIQAKALTLIIPRKANTIAVSLRHLGYGDFEQYDAGGNRLGDYISGDTWITGSSAYGFQDKKLLVGATGGFFISQLEDYQSIVLTLSAGTIYNIKSMKLRLGLSHQNSGFVLTRKTSEK